MNFAPMCAEHDLDYILGRTTKKWADSLLLHRTLSASIHAKSQRAADSAVRRHLLLAVLGWVPFWYHAIQRWWRKQSA